MLSPPAHFPQDIDGRRGNPPQIVRADIQEIVDAALVQVFLDRRDLVSAFPVVVKGLIAPGIVQRRRRFKQHVALVVVRNLIISRRRVIAMPVADARIDQAIGLVGLHHAVQLIALWSSVKKKHKIK